MQRLKDIGELAAIERLARHLPMRPDVLTGIGDDCAVVRAGGNSKHDWLLTSDPVVEGIHFTHDTDPKAVGHKAIGRVLSDIAAMGGEPCWALMDFVAPSDTTVATLDGIYEGIAGLAEKFGMSVVGGDGNGPGGRGDPAFGRQARR